MPITCAVVFFLVLILLTCSVISLFYKKCKLCIALANLVIILVFCIIQISDPNIQGECL